MRKYKRVHPNTPPKGGWRYPGMKKPWEHEPVTFKKRLEYQKARTIKKKELEKQRKAAKWERDAPKREARKKASQKKAKDKYRKKQATKKRVNKYKYRHRLKRNREKIVESLIRVLKGQQKASDYYREFAMQLTKYQINSLDPEVRKALLETCNVHIFEKKSDPLYHRQSIMLEDKFNILEHYNTVRHFLQARHNITSLQLEMILWLYPQAFVTKKQINSFERKYNETTLTAMTNKKLIEFYKTVRMENGTKPANVYRLTMFAKNIVTKTYKYLSGELPLPKHKYLNPLLDITDDSTVNERLLADKARELTVRPKQTRFSASLSQAREAKAQELES